jgi:hypothetical protein
MPYDLGKEAGYDHVTEYLEDHDKKLSAATAV